MMESKVGEITVENYVKGRLFTLRTKEGFHLQRLTGGMVNYVYRLESLSTSPPEDPEEPRSFILKHYQPFLASSPNVMLSCDRYFVEKRALQIFSNTTHNSQSLPRIPQLLHFDDSDHILVIEDCGSSIFSLFELFIALKSSPPSSERLEEILTSITDNIHNLENSLAVITKNTSAQEMSKYFVEDTNRMIESYVYEPFSERVQAFPALHKFISLVERSRKKRQEVSQELLKTHFQQVPENYQIIFGDLWPNAIFFPQSTIDDQASLNQEITTADQRIIILDWEFIHIEHKLNDYFQLFAYICLMEHDSQYLLVAVIRLKQRLLDYLIQDQRFNIIEENIALFLADIALVINDDRWKFTKDKSIVCEEIAVIAEILLESVQPKNYHSLSISPDPLLRSHL